MLAYVLRRAGHWLFPNQRRTLFPVNFGKSKHASRLVVLSVAVGCAAITMSAPILLDALWAVLSTEVGEIGGHAHRRSRGVLVYGEM